MEGLPSPSSKSNFHVNPINYSFKTMCFTKPQIPQYIIYKCYFGCKNIYRTRVITTRGYYYFERFQLRLLIKRGYYSRAGSIEILPKLALKKC